MILKIRKGILGMDLLFFIRFSVTLVPPDFWTIINFINLKFWPEYFLIIITFQVLLVPLDFWKIILKISQRISSKNLLIFIWFPVPPMPPDFWTISSFGNLISGPEIIRNFLIIIRFLVVSELPDFWKIIRKWSRKYVKAYRKRIYWFLSSFQWHQCRLISGLSSVCFTWNFDKNTFRIPDYYTVFSDTNATWFLENVPEIILKIHPII